jgi:hypothetical protein
MPHPERPRETPDFVVADVLDLTEYSDRAIVTTVVDRQGARIRLHLTTATAELLCERIANTLERRYGKS